MSVTKVLGTICVQVVPDVVACGSVQMSTHFLYNETVQVLGVNVDNRVAVDSCSALCAFACLNAKCVLSGMTML